MPQIHIDIHRDLIEACIQGDRSAYYQLYKLYSRAMYNTACRITKNEQDAEDILQESFISAFEKLKSFSGNSTFGAWIKRIVVNKSINLLRKRHLHMLSLENSDLDMAEDERDGYKDFEYNVEIIKKAVEELPEGYRLVLTLYLFEGYDHAEIADILKISISTSKSQYNRAKKKLLQMLQEKEVYYG